MAYPLTIDAYRVKENMPGVVYDAAKKQVLFVEDVQAVEQSIIRIENTLGTTEDIPVIPSTGFLFYFWNWMYNIYAGRVDIKPTAPAFFPTTVIVPATAKGPFPQLMPVASLTPADFYIRRGVTTTYYRMLLSFNLTLVNNPTIYVTYLNVTTNQIVAAPQVLVGDILPAHVYLHFSFNYNDATTP